MNTTFAKIVAVHDAFLEVNASASPQGPKTSYTQSQFENFCATDPLRGLKPAVDTVSQQIPQVKTKITGSGSCILSKV